MAAEWGSASTGLDDGTATLSVPLADGATALGDLVVTMTDEGHLRIEWQQADGAPPLSGFEAWAREA